MWSTEINYGDGNGDGHGEGWSKIVKDGKRQWELVFTALSLHFHCISAFDFLSKNVPKFWLCRWTFISQKKKSRPPYGGRLFSVNIPKIWILWGLFPYSRFLPHFQINSVVLPPSFYGGLTWPFHSVMNKGAQATEITWIHGNFRKSLKNTNSRGCFDQFNDPVREPYINGRLLYSVNWIFLVTRAITVPVFNLRCYFLKLRC